MTGLSNLVRFPHQMAVFISLLPLMYLIPSHCHYTRVGTLIVAAIYLQVIQNRYMFRSFTVFNVVTSIVYNPLPPMCKS